MSYRPSYPVPPYQASGYFPPPGGGTAITAAIAGLVLIGLTGVPIYLAITPLVGNCGSDCFTGMVMAMLLVFPLANLLLLIGAILVLARKAAGAALLAIGALLALGLTAAWLFVGLSTAETYANYVLQDWRGWMMIIAMACALLTLIFALLPPTWRYLRSSSDVPARTPPGYPRPPGY
ncbi:MAG: hypothetical protein J2O49_08365 [Sciscionella sp.]|nr:hypothetical protein [Sciscionella sp.]